ncbi:MAG: GDP-mannose 4,6-dehydratase [Chloroflexia bacterium]|nr:GDP-mannose 4,6-dehydratase [Chloroflexia bacterium]
MRILITGSAGFAGSHLCDLLTQEKAGELYAICYRACSTAYLDPIRDRLHLLSGDLLDAAWVQQVVAESRPDVVAHLAALSSPAASFSQPARTLSNNMLAQLNLFQAILEAGLDPLILIISSGDIYGLVQPEDIPVDEDTPLRPTSPYSVSKIAQDYMALQYFLSHKLRTVRLRPFNHIGPRQAVGFVTADFARQIALIEAGQQAARIQVGNLSARRDFTDVRDMVRAYSLAMTRGEPGQAYNVGSGEHHSIEEILQILLRLSHCQIDVETDLQRLRPVDVPVIACDSRRFRQRTGWTPSIPLEQSLQDILDDWRQRISD